MIIKSIFRRYERWNPVHPTYGAFWGVGLGIGCGVGWGPGFGPEVIGYVGAGCGAGFSVGITFLGIGIGLPANYLLPHLPHNALVLPRRVASEVTQYLLQRKSSFEGRDLVHSISFSLPRIENWTEHTRNITNMKDLVVSKSKGITDHCDSIRKRLFPPPPND